MTQATDSDDKKHNRKMEVRKFYAGVVIYSALAAVDLFYREVPMYLYGFAVVVLGLNADAIPAMFNKK